MKKKKKILVCILSAMILGSCLATPAFAAQPGYLSGPGLMDDFPETSTQEPEIEDETILNQVTNQLPLTDSQMTQHEETITTYKDGTEITDTLIVRDIPLSKVDNNISQTAPCDVVFPIPGIQTGMKTIKYEKSIKKSTEKVATFSIETNMMYNSLSNQALHINHKKQSWVNKKHTVKYFNTEVLTRTSGGKTSCIVKGKFKIYLTGIPAISNSAQLEVGIHSNGKTIHK